MSEETRESGTTLIEMLVVLLLLGMTVAMAVPHLAGYSSASRLGRSADVLAGHLDLARQIAVARRYPVRVLLHDPDERHYRIHQDVNSNGSIDAGEAVDGPIELPRGVAFSGLALAGDGQLVMLPSGRLRVGEGGTFSLVDDGGRILNLEVFGSGLLGPR